MKPIGAIGCAVAISALSTHAPAASHEIQVHTDDIAGYREHSLELHLNASRPRAGGHEPRRTTSRGMPEYAYGFARNWELSLGLPITRVGSELDAEGLRAQVQYVAPRDRAHRFYWGLNAELSYDKQRPDQSAWSVELVPILGVRLERWHFALNPVLERNLRGRERRVEFKPAGMAVFELNDRHEVGLEYYAELGPLDRILPTREQSHTAFAVWNYEGAPFDLNLGVGRGLTRASDRWVAKLILEMKLK